MLSFLEAQDSIISTGGGTLNSNKYESKNNFNFFGSMSLRLYYRSEFQRSLTIYRKKMVAIWECKFLMADFVKQAISPDSFYRFQLPSTKFGQLAWAKAGFCPVHADSRAGTFFINAGRGSYCCFSCGAKGGDIIDFTRERYGINYSEALHKLADDWGLS